MDWDNTTIPEGAEKPREIPPVGEYAFLIAKFKRATFQPKPGSSGKIKGSCPMAEFELFIGSSPENQYTVETRLIIHESCVGLMAAFARAIGQRKHGDGETKIDWSTVPQARGFCKVTHRTYKNASNEEKVAYDVKFCDPEETKLSKDIAAGVVNDPLDAPF